MGWGQICGLTLVGIVVLIWIIKQFDKAAYDVERLKAKHNTERLITVMLQQPGLRLKAAEALGQLGDASAVRALITASEDPNREVQKALVEALRNLGESAIEGLVDSLRRGSHRKFATETLGKMGAPAVEPLVALLNSQTGAARQAAANVLVSLYRGTTLSEEQRAKLLAQRAVITERHQDNARATHTEDTTLNIDDSKDHTDTYEHGDRGIGRDFPL